jgi:hypothetical protein
MNVILIERSDCGSCKIGRNTVSWIRQILRGEQVWCNSDESFGGELIGDTSHPRRQAVDLMHDNYNRSLRFTLGINHEGAYAVGAR